MVSFVHSGKDCGPLHGHKLIGLGSNRDLNDSIVPELVSVVALPATAERQLPRFCGLSLGERKPSSGQIVKSKWESGQNKTFILLLSE
jgi:hypothetical protein